MELPGTGIVLTSDWNFYFAGQLFLWVIIVWGAIGLARTKLQIRQRLMLAGALVFAFVSSFCPLFLRLVIAMPGLGGVDAGGEEFWLSFSTTCPQAVAFALLLWVALRQPQVAPNQSTNMPDGITR